MTTAAALLLAALQAAPTPAAPSAAAPPPAKAGSTVQGVTVTAAARDYRSDIDRKSYSLAKDLQASTGSIADALRNVPSVEVDVQGKVSLRGDPSVTILVDGRPSVLFQGANRGDVLQQLPADQYEQVEVMTNPSAAFKPDGTGGIINLITKKAHVSGRTGTVKANVADKGRGNAGLNVTSSEGRFSFSGGVNGNRSRNRSLGESDQQVIDPATGAFTPITVRSGGINTYSGGSGRAGLDFDLDAKTRLSASVNVGGGRYSSTDRTTSRSALANNAYDAVNRDEGDYEYGEASATYLRKFDGPDHELSVRGSFSGSRNGGVNTSAYVYQAPGLAAFTQAIEAPTQRETASLKAEYKGPLPGSAKLTTGYELEAGFATLPKETSIALGGGPLTFQPGLSNRFEGSQIVQALYATYQRGFGKLTVMPGLRLEDVQIDTDLVTTGRSDSWNYARAYPTLHLSYGLDDQQKLTASYSRRVQRPDIGQLNPFRTYLGPLSYSEGNPRLRPQVTESFEGGWEYRKNSTSYQATLYWRQNHDRFTSVNRDLGDGVLLSTTGNLGQSRNGGVELVASGKWPWKLSYNLSSNLYWNEIDATNLVNGTKRSGYTGTIRGTLTWEPTAKDFVQLTGNARGKTITAQGYVEPSGVLNIGYRRKFTDKLWGVLQISDVFQSAEYVGVIDTQTLKQRSRYSYSERMITFGFNYAFGGKPGAKQRPEGFDFGGGGGR